MTADTINTLATITHINPFLILALILWSFVWKGLALWKSATLRQKWWFIILLVINTVGILEIIYYFFVSRDVKVEVIEESSES
jgi:hypothetical protein